MRCRKRSSEYTRRVQIYYSNSNERDCIMIAMTARAQAQQVLLIRTNQQFAVVRHTVSNKPWDFLLLPSRYFGFLRCTCYTQTLLREHTIICNISTTQTKHANEQYQDYPILHPAGGCLLLLLLLLEALAAVLLLLFRDTLLARRVRLL